MTAENTARKQQRGRPFAPGVSGNPFGRPSGSRNRATVAAELLLDGEAENLTRKAIDLAMEGNVVALRLCLERVLPPRRDRAVDFAMGRLESVKSVTRAMADLMRAVGAGQLAPAEAADVSRLLGTYLEALCATHLEQRIAALEDHARKRTGGGLAR